MDVAVGNPIRLKILEHATSLHATLVVLDRWESHAFTTTIIWTFYNMNFWVNLNFLVGRRLKKYGTFFGKRIPSSVVVMNGDGGVDLLKVQSAADQSDTTPGETPMTAAPPTPQVILSSELSQLLGPRLRQSLARV